MKNEISSNKKLFEISKAIKLPDVIVNKKDVFIHYDTKTNINFITEKSILGKVKILSNKTMIKKKIDINYCSVKGKYIEIDTFNDFNLAQQMFKK